MKKLIAIFILLSLVMLIPETIFADVQNTVNVDDAITDVLNGINESEFQELVELLNKISGSEKTLKEWIVYFITGDYSLSLDGIKNYLSETFGALLSSVLTVMLVVIFVGILCSVSNAIISKNSDKNENSIIYYICLIIVITLLSGFVSSVFSFAVKGLKNLTNILNLVFPLLITLAEFTGGFGVTAVKPFTVIVSFLTSNVATNLLLPLLSVSIVTVIVSNLSTGIKLSNLTKTINSLVKWSLGIITALLTIVITGQSVVNMQYNGISFKILKYATGTLIPIVGSFISGGMNVVLSSVVLVKNAFGLLSCIFVFFSLGVNGLTVLILSFVMRFMVSVAEPIIDNKIASLITGITEVFNCVSAIIFVCAFAFILVCVSLISTTALIL